MNLQLDIYQWTHRLLFTYTQNAFHTLKRVETSLTRWYQIKQFPHKFYASS